MIANNYLFVIIYLIELILIFTFLIENLMWRYLGYLELFLIYLFNCKILLSNIYILIYKEFVILINVRLNWKTGIVHFKFLISYKFIFNLILIHQYICKHILIYKSITKNDYYCLISKLIFKTVIIR